MRKLLVILALLSASAFGQDTLTGLELAYKAQEGTGTSLADSSANSNTGTITNGSWTTGSGSITNMIAFNGTSTRIDTSSHANLDFDFNHPFSIGCWIVSTSATNQAGCFDKMNSAASYQGYSLMLSNSGTSQCSSQPCMMAFLNNSYSSNALQVVANTTVSLNTLHMLFLTYDGSHVPAGMKFYLDGSLLSTNVTAFNSLTTTATNTLNPRLGQLLDGTSILNGKYGPAYAYNRALTATDVAYLFAHPYSFVLSTTSAITGPSVLAAGVTGAYVLTLSAPYTGTCTPSDGGAGGTFTPSSLSFSAETAKNFTYSNASTGTVTLTSSCSPALTSNGTYAVSIRNGATYCVAASGSDSNTGLCTCTGSSCTGSPWQTATKVGTFGLVAGDIVRFNRGDTFSGGMSICPIGSQAAPILIEDYGTGAKPIITAASSGNGDGVDICGTAEFYTIQNTHPHGNGWTGTGASATATNIGAGIWAPTTVTSVGLRNVNILNNTIDGFYQCALFDASAATNLVGQQNLNFVGNDCSNNLSLGFQNYGYNPFTGGPKNQSSNILIADNTFVNIPGDPNSGNGTALHYGSVKSEASAIQIYSTQGATVRGNFTKQVGGFGGLLTGLVNGGSAAIAATNSDYVYFLGNEVRETNEVSILTSDGAAYDIDVNTRNFLVEGNLSYSNIGPCLQIGGNNPTRYAGNGVFRHNVCYGDDIGVGGGSTQGMVRSFGYAENISFIANTFIMPCSGTTGSPNIVSNETANDSNWVFVNNIFKTCNGYPIKTGSAPSGTNYWLGNLYDFSGGTTTYQSGVTTIAGWRALGAGVENLNGIDYGKQGSANLVGSFSAPSNGFIANGGLKSITAFNLQSTSDAIGLGVFPGVAPNAISDGGNLGLYDFRGSPAMPSSQITSGAVAYPQPSSTGSGPGPIVIQ